MEDSKRKLIRENLQNLREKNKKNFSKYLKVLIRLDLFIPGFMAGIMVNRLGKIYFTIEPLFASKKNF